MFLSLEGSHFVAPEDFCVRNMCRSNSLLSFLYSTNNFILEIDFLLGKEEQPTFPMEDVYMFTGILSFSLFISLSLYLSSAASSEEVILCISVHRNVPGGPPGLHAGEGQCSAEGALSIWDKTIVHHAGPKRRLEDVWGPAL